jgi:hypothetical protein
VVQRRSVFFPLPAHLIRNKLYKGNKIKYEKTKIVSLFIPACKLVERATGETPFLE